MTYLIFSSSLFQAGNYAGSIVINFSTLGILGTKHRNCVKGKNDISLHGIIQGITLFVSAVGWILLGWRK